MKGRIFPWIKISLPFEYQAQLQGSEYSFSNRAVMKNFSIEGLHMSETAPVLQPDDIADFIFRFRSDQVHPLIPHKIKAQGRVISIEQPTKESSRFRVVLEFLSGPFFIYGD
ncbi:MAG: hypothetical protein ACLQUW_16615 [Desulfobaccales bacterium]